MSKFLLEDSIEINNEYIYHNLPNIIIDCDTKENNKLLKRSFSFSFRGKNIISKLMFIYVKRLNI